MKRSEIIRKTLSEMDWPSDYVTIATAELEKRLPNKEFRVCGDFSTATGDCCEPCHTSHPHYDMMVVELPDGVLGWVCCAVAQRINGSTGHPSLDFDDFPTSLITWADSVP
jgi:hypothetical protein